MIKRINLIEKQPFSFTYLKLLQIVSVIILVVAVFSANQYFQHYRIQKKITSEQANLTKLKAEHDSLRSQPIKKKLDIGKFQELVDKIEGAPRWSRILNEISLRMPGRLRLTTIKSLAPADKAVTVSKKKDADKKEDDPTKKDPSKKTKQATQDYSMRRMEISGLSNDERMVTEFLRQLRESEQFKNAILNESQQDSFGYSFKITSEAINHVK